MKRLFLCFFLLLLLNACTPYQKSSILGGYSDIKLADNIFKVSFRGNAYTNSERARDFALLRSAEVALENGFKYFAFVQSENYTTSYTSKSPIKARTTGSGYLSGNRLNYNSETQITGGDVTTFSKPNSSNIIVCYKVKPKDIFVFEAQTIKESIRKQYKIIS